MQLYRLASLIFYLLIYLKGQMVGMPFVCFLAFSLFDFLSTDQLLSGLAIIGLIISFVTMDAKRTTKVLFLDIVSFIMLLYVITWKLATTPIWLFNYPAFIIPLIFFLVLYSLSLYHSFRLFQQTRPSQD